jgi:hypothetical protein
MNPNGTHNKDQKRLRQVERLLEHGEASGDTLLDELARATLQADAAFQQRLEDQLMTRLYDKQSEQDSHPMQRSLTLQTSQNIDHRFARFSLPITLVAATLALVFAGIALTVLESPQNDPPSASNFMMVITETPVQNLQAQEVFSCNFDVDWTEYRVQEGDTLLSIADSNGFAQALSDESCRVDSEDIAPGQIILIPRGVDLAATQGTGTIGACVTQRQLGTIIEFHPYPSLDTDVEARVGDESQIRVINGTLIGGAVWYQALLQVGDATQVGWILRDQIAPLPESCRVMFVSVEPPANAIYCIISKRQPLSVVTMYAEPTIDSETIATVSSDGPLLAVGKYDQNDATWYQVMVDSTYTTETTSGDPQIYTGWVQVDDVGPLPAECNLQAGIQAPSIPQNLQPVVIAIDDIRAETQLTADMLTTIYRSADVDLSGVAVSVNDVVGLFVTEDIGWLRPIPSESLAGSRLEAGGFAYGGLVSDTNSQRAIDAMRTADMTWMRLQIDYQPDMHMTVIADAIQSAHDNGFKLSLNITTDPSAFDAPPLVEAYRRGYVSFVAQIAAMGPDAIEIGNEPNIDRGWFEDEIGGDRYARLLADTAPAIKSANSDVIIISAAPAPTGAQAAFPGQVINDDHFLQQMIDAGGLDYVDCVGMSYLEGVVGPRDATGDPRDNYYTRYLPTMVQRYSEIIDGRKPLCVTELGYLAGLDDLSAARLGDLSAQSLDLPTGFEWAADTTRSNQMRWLRNAADYLRETDTVHMMLIWNIDLIDEGDTVSAGYAYIGPYGECWGCGGEQIIPNGTVGITVPLDAISSVEYGLQPHDTVDVVAAMLFVDVGDGVQSVVKPEDAIQVGVPVEIGEPALTVQRVIADAQVIGIFGDFITLAVSPDDAVVMQWLIDSEVPIMLIKINR